MVRQAHHKGFVSEIPSSGSGLGISDKALYAYLTKNAMTKAKIASASVNAMPMNIVA